MSLMLTIALAAGLLLAASTSAAAKEKAADKWVEQDGGELSKERQSDGDSFGIELKSPKGNKILRTYRLYGVDCPESDRKDPFVMERIKEQAEHFDVPPEEIPALGKQAAAFTEKLLKTGKPRVVTRGKLGEKAEKHKGRPQRYFALVEVTGPDGKRRWLHELLLEAGLARAFGVAAAWPPEQEDRHGEEEAKARFMKDLKHRENAGKRARLGAWKKAG